MTEIIYSYTVEQAIEDGFMVDIDQATSLEAGITIPVTLTREVYAECVELPEGYQGFQDLEGRLWDVLWMARVAMQRHAQESGICPMVVIVRGVRKDGYDKAHAKEQHLWIGMNAKRDGSPVLTIMFPHER